MMPTEELLENRECQNIVLLWEGGTDAPRLIREVDEVPDDTEFQEIGKKFFPEFDFYFFG